MFKLSEITCKTALNSSKIPGMDYCLNPYRGCSHACVYCYAGCLARFRGLAEKWGTYVEVKVDFARRLAGQLKRPKRGTVMLSSVTDPYQVTEAKYGLTRQCLELLAQSGLRVSILTKSDLVQRDLDILRLLPGAEVGFSITTADDRLARLLEPGAPPPSRRLAALEKLAGAGVRTWVFIAPVLPGINDAPEGVQELLRAANQAGAEEIHFDSFNFYPLAVAQIAGLIDRYWPDRKPAFTKACQNHDFYRLQVKQLFKSLGQLS